MSVKELIIAILVVTSGIFNAYLWKQLVFLGVFSDGVLFSLPIASLFLFATALALVAMLGETLWLGVAAVFAAFTGSFFFVRASMPVISGLVLTLLFGLLAYRSIRKAAKSENTFGVNKVLRQGLPFFFTAVAVMVSIFYFSRIIVSDEQTFIPETAFELTLPYLEDALQNIIPGFQASASVDELLRKNAEDQLKSTGISQTSRSQIEKLVEEQRKVLEQGLGINVSGKERAGNLIYRLANQKIEDFLGEYKRYVPYLSAFGFFLAIKALTFPLYLISLGVVWGSIKMLLALGVIKRETVSVEVERLTL
ncbi:MAG: hypothetical protein HYW90_03565 [Candidatus Sungbacteria bacterium]|nr:hypothetical protein [Candidatus Sungbacteria bacterium]